VCAPDIFFFGLRQMAAGPRKPGGAPRVSVLLEIDLPLGDGVEESGDLSDRISTYLGAPADQLEWYRLQASPRASGSPPVAVRLKSDQMTVSHFHRLMADNSGLRAALERANEATAEFSAHSEQQRRQLVDVKGAPPGADVCRGTSSPTEGARQAAQRKLEAVNRALAAEAEELRARLQRGERFKKEVLQTVKELKLQLAILTEELLFHADASPEETEGSEPDE
jgi:hypothetical protein